MKYHLDFGFSNLQKEMNRLLDGWRDSSPRLMSPACDIEESENQYLISFDVPGVSKDNLKIELHDRELTVSGERKRECRQTKTKGQRTTECFEGCFERSFLLPSTVDTNKMEADYADGVLRISLPKSATAQSTQIKITDRTIKPALSSAPTPSTVPKEAMKEPTRPREKASAHVA